MADRIVIKRNSEDSEMLSILDGQGRLFAVCHGDLLSYAHNVMLDDGYCMELEIPKASEIEKNETQ